MPIVLILLALVAVGVVLWLINTKVPWIDPTVKQIINVVAIILVVIWLMRVFGLWSLLMTARV